jgi:hypothetical protein
MKLNKCVFYWLVTLAFFSFLLSEENDPINLNSQSNKPLFVSLGNHCSTALFISNGGRRVAAFPFDWILTLDSSKFELLLQNNFHFFLDKNFLIQAQDGTIVNTFYNINFRHDWPLPLQDFDSNLLQIQEKYQRRIKRFNKLINFKGRVYFVR